MDPSPAREACVAALPPCSRRADLAVRGARALQTLQLQPVRDGVRAAQPPPVTRSTHALRAVPGQAQDLQVRSPGAGDGSRARITAP
jgi:hypothetical protein